MWERRLARAEDTVLTEGDKHADPNEVVLAVVSYQTRALRESVRTSVKEGVKEGIALGLTEAGISKAKKKELAATGGVSAAIMAMAWAVWERLGG
jgi:hypothetical protein